MDEKFELYRVQCEYYVKGCHGCTDDKNPLPEMKFNRCKDVICRHAPFDIAVKKPVKVFDFSNLG